MVDERRAAPPAYGRHVWSNCYRDPFVLALATLRCAPLRLSAMTYGGLSQSHCQFSNGTHEKVEVAAGTCPTGQRSFGMVKKNA